MIIYLLKIYVRYFIPIAFMTSPKVAGLVVFMGEVVYLKSEPIKDQRRR